MLSSSEHPTLPAGEDGAHIVKRAGLGIGPIQPAKELADGGSLMPLLEQASAAGASLGRQLVEGVWRRRRAA